MSFVLKNHQGLWGKVHEKKNKNTFLSLNIKNKKKTLMEEQISEFQNKLKYFIY